LRKDVWRVTVAVVAAVAASTVLVGPASAANNGNGGGNNSSGGYGSEKNPKMTAAVVGKAAPDECWVMPTDPTDATQFGQYVAPTGTDTNGGVICPAGSTPKVNQAYVWGLARTGNDLWFGTVANTQCLVMGTYLQLTQPMLNKTSVCELSASPNPAPLKSKGLGDWRPPRLFRYTMGSAAQPVQLTSLAVNAATKTTILALLSGTVGIRSAASVPDPFVAGRNLIVFAGPSLSGGLTTLVFGDDGTFIDGRVLPAYNDVRRWVTYGGRIYTGVGVVAGGGAVLRWTPVAADAGAGTPADYLTFETVAALPSDAAELTLADNRLVVGTWPGGGHEAGVWISPADKPIPDLTAADSWTPVWTASDYEPDPVTAATYGGGAMSYYGGYVYWGTMHVPGVAFEAAMQMHPGTSTADALANFVGTSRAISVFRADVSTGAVQLLYGEAQLPAYSNGSWQLVNNNMGGAAGLYGSSGFGNPFNNYTWSMATYGGQLYVGTMDWSYLAGQAWPALVQQLGLPADTPNPIPAFADYGADLWRFSSTRAAAKPVYTNGVGNYLNYGVRNMLSVEDASSSVNGLYLGMADPENLATTGTGPKGGWELIRMTNATK
jgi:hypothetical protein